jgi:PAS domain S-box-containing protein
MNSHRGYNLLLIDDDPDTRANLRDILELDGHNVDVAGTGVEALRREDWSRYVAILLDRRLPDTTADELLPELKLRAPDAAVIVITGYADLQGVVSAFRQGVNDYVLKPINADAIRMTLNRVADQRRMTLAKERSEAAFRQLVEAADAMIVILRVDRRTAYLSPYAERLTGYSNAEVVGRDFVTLFYPDCDSAATTFFELDAGRSDQSGHEATMVTRDGVRRMIVWNSRRLDDYDGEAAVLAVGHDITSLKLAQERALQAERLAAIGQMVTGLAHESRNALQRSQACLEMLALKVADRAEAIDLIKRLQQAQDDIHHLYEDVRDYAAPIRLHLRLTDLSSTWRDAWLNLEQNREGRIATLSEELGGLDLHCQIDPFRIKQVFQNILDNSISASSESVCITIRAEEVELEGRPAVCIRVRDDGPGLDSEQRERLFDAFFTTKTRGTGLGMAIVKRIVEAHGGRISLGEAGNPGTELLVTLPRNQP